ncbi:MAG: 23S rRNA (adenine(2503)-C(2))-methyltransferase RlmN [bacterium]
MPSLCALLLDPGALEATVMERGGRAFHARILRREVLERGTLKYEAMTGLPDRLRESLSRDLPVLGLVELARSPSKDGTCKLLLGLAEGEGSKAQSIETVHIPPLSRKAQSGATLCVSTQVGCPVGCPFCASGKAGLVRNLRADEILEQYLHGRALGAIARSVVMGIGEPLLNFDALLAALTIVHKEMGIGARKITVSSVGFPERVRRAALARPPFQLAISLHTAFDEERAALVPAMAKTPIEEVLSAGDFWFETTGREVTYEVVLLAGLNDTLQHAEELGRRLAGRRATVNLIPFNPVVDGDFQRPEGQRVDEFRELVENAGVVARVRWSRGLESDAACGQLRLRN